MKYAIATVAILASLFGQIIALRSTGVYEIQSARSGDVWGIQQSIGVKHQVEIVHYTRKCKVDTLGNDAQLFRVIQNDDNTFTFQLSGTPLVVAAGEGAELEAQHSDPSVDAAFLLHPIDSECE
ncbi:hypothetical protein PCG10_009740 [Penicillium crustosum]|uniref:Uncharacterized protein n=1 Tax=Penicillium crustosum TaxID=36656 RepID=A0A9P5GJ88_PENCR|nr:hypothetical protein PCG10_009740 [Penicillium crustosum]